MTGRHGVLVGATASGKSSLALELARGDSIWEIVSVDSMQVYRGMDVGTAKPTTEERARVSHHMVDVVDPWEETSVAWFQRAARAAIADIEARGRRALLVGGTALYVQAVVDDLEIPGRYPDVRAELEGEADTGALHDRLATLDPRAASRIEPANRRRLVRALEVTLGSGRPFSDYGPGVSAHPPTEFALVGLRRDPEVLAQRITRRYRQQVDAGLLDEVIGLRSHPLGLSRTAAQALAYKELMSFLDGEVTLGEALELAERRTRRFARRQRAWFGRDPRITWIDAPAGSGNLLVDALAAHLG